MQTVDYFKKLYDCGNVDIQRVFPTMQIYVKKINERYKNDERIACIMLFGSSVSMMCNQHSDIDIMVRLKDDDVNLDNKNEISEELQELCDWKADIIWFDRISKEDRIYENILTGVQIL